MPQDFCNNVAHEQVTQFKFYEEIRKFEKIDSNDDRKKKAREIYDTFIMRELLSNSGNQSQSRLENRGYTPFFREKGIHPFI